ncbi:site-specific DNA-methyltransferase [Yonghaparkia sp. Soil809]|uniref:DNA-methyltransferase n=1 Tax=Yonghaparkia sp. Soil809 TaxID=1736417 RepID=UPI0006FD809F|nr:site-specific DNA-methyltransferase [Yonghaparkia sp. Soil809]KRF33359.1 DNA methyltransferase [Yonghaparkia sp. Soil809]
MPSPQPTPLWAPDSPDLLIHADNLTAMRRMPDSSMRMAYLDPPFNTGRAQLRRTTSHSRASAADDESTPTPTAWQGFGGESYIRTVEALSSYDDRFADYWAFLAPRLQESHRLLDDRGTLYLHLDYREAHYAKVALDALFGRDCFLNEIIWAYDYGAKSRSRWPTKHDTILVYVKDPERYLFDSTEVDREPYMAPGLVTPEKAARGKLPTDVWWHTIVGTTSREKTGYPTQKPVGILRRMIQASTAPGDWVLDPFAGSGTTAAAARALGRRSVSIDSGADAVAVIERRLALTATRL